MKKIMKHLDKPLLIISVLLFALGLIMVFSASNVTAYMSHAVSPYNYFLKQSVFLIGGLIVAFIMICIPLKVYDRYSNLAMLVGLIALALLPVFGVEINDAKSWYDLKIFNLQPSEFMKVITILWMACYYDKKQKKLDKYVPSLFPIVLGGIAAYFMFEQPDLGTTIIYAVIMCSIYWISPVKKILKYKSGFIAIGIVLLGAIILFGTGGTLLRDRQLERLTEYKNPCDKLLSSGNQVCNSYIAINNGGLTGEGLGNSTQKYLYLPEPYTDFIFAIIVEELGLIVGIGIILAYILILYRILKVGRESYTDKGAMICFGVAVYIFIHIAVNLLGLFGLIPMTGVPLPFMSYGGSFTVCLIIALALVQRISIENGLTKEKELQKK
ncbi:MAG: FtsW/RodA/SpoVE family cell cycle protein [Bacilli bacterium]|nr:FtsW/RodA/SpoVE family cell cycle protein [Bacilli bacterium]